MFIVTAIFLIYVGAANIIRPCETHLVLKVMGMADIVPSLPRGVFRGETNPLNKDHTSWRVDGGVHPRIENG